MILITVKKNPVYPIIRDCVHSGTGQCILSSKLRCLPSDATAIEQYCIAARSAPNCLLVYARLL